MLVPVFADFARALCGLARSGSQAIQPRSSDVLLLTQPKKIALNAYKDILER